MPCIPGADTGVLNRGGATLLVYTQRTSRELISAKFLIGGGGPGPAEEGPSRYLNLILKHFDTKPDK